MSDTDKNWPPPASPPAPAPAPLTLGQRIVEVAARHVGETEIVGNGQANDGPPVEYSCRRWIRTEARYRRLYDAGKLEWCCGFACSVAQDAGSRAVVKIASLSCTSLWSRALEQAKKPEPTILAWTPSAARTEPLPGDFLLTDSDGNGKPGHVVIVTAIGPAGIATIGGNSGPKANSVFRKTYAATDPTIFGFVRLLA